MIVDKNRVYDGWLTLEGGVDAGRLPDTLDVNQAESARNMTFRGGSATTRPGFRKLDEGFEFHQVWCFAERHQYDSRALTWLFNAGTTMEYPGDNQMRVNSLFLSQVTRMAIQISTHANQNVSAFLGSLRSGNTIILEDLNAPEIWYRYQVTDTPTGLPAGAVTWYRVPVVRITGPTNTRPAHGHEVRLGFGTNFSGSLYIDGEYKPANVSTVDPDPPHHNPAPWFENQNSESIYRHGIMQCAHAYNPHNGEDCIMALIGGRLFRIIPGVNTADVEEVLINQNNVYRGNFADVNRPRNLRNRDDLPIAYMVQADKFLIAQDGNSGAIIYDANKARRARTDGSREETEIPTGTIMAYGMGRIIVIVNKRDVAFGDIYGSHDLPDPADSLLLFTERNFLAEGFDAAIPFTQGIATGMIFFPQLDTSTGNGQLMVFAEKGATSFFLSIPRELWKTSSFQILALLTTGLRGHRSISVANEDLWFRSDDGMRSYRQARSEQGGWAHIPLSTNVRQYLDNDSDWLLKYCSAIYFDNRILVTTSPRWNNGRPAHYGLAVVDFDIISSFGSTIGSTRETKPAWEGQWLNTKLQPVQLLSGTFNGATRAFMFGLTGELDEEGNPVLDENGAPVLVNQLYEISLDDKDDFDGERINWELISRSFDFNKLDPQASTVFTENELYDGDLWLKEIIE